MRVWLAIAALNGALAVALGAIGAHVLGASAPGAARGVFDTAVRYHFMHALALLGTALAYPYFASGAGRWLVTVAGIAFAAGIVLFCGGLYILSGLNIAAGAMFAPIGGSLFVVGWLALAATSLVPPIRR